jgi:hypothetical protein
MWGTKHFVVVAQTNDDVLTRLAIGPFSRLFTCEGDMEYTGCGNTEQRGLKTREPPCCHLAQISWR